MCMCVCACVCVCGGGISSLLSLSAKGESVYSLLRAVDRGSLAAEVGLVAAIVML